MEERINGKYLPEDEKNDLACLAQAGDTNATATLVNEYKNMIRGIAFKMNRPDLMDDLMQTGVVALLEVIQRYDFSLGVNFTTYARSYIKGYILIEVNSRGGSFNFNTTRLGRRLSSQTKIESHLRATLDREPTVSDIAEYLGVTIEKVMEVLSKRSTSSLNESAGPENEGKTLLDYMPDTKQKSPDEGNAYWFPKLEEAMSTLTERQKYIVQGRHGEEKRTLKDLGNEFKVTKETARKDYDKAMEKLRACIDQINISTSRATSATPL